MSANLKMLASLMRLKKERGEPFVLLLGAGASMSSGVPPTPTIMSELLAQFPQSPATDLLEDRFNRLWKSFPDDTRGQVLNGYLAKEPSRGYLKLAELIKAGYFDVILSFNFDLLLEKALRKVGLDEYRHIIRGEHNEDTMQTLLDAREPRVKLVKLHGSFNSADYFLFDAAEMYAYPPPIEAMVTRATSRDIVVCGYAFNDDCVVKAFAKQGNSVFCVNPSGVPRRLAMFLKDRRSDNNEIRERFDEFFDALHEELLFKAPDPVKLPPNPFKFLESYERCDSDSFKGRDDEIASFFTYLDQTPARRVMVITGPNKAGKTSLARAGILPRLETPAFRSISIRSRTDIETYLPSELLRMKLVPEMLELPAALEHLVNSNPGRRIILFLDQFERVTNRFDLRTPQGRASLREWLRNGLLKYSNDRLTLVLIVTDEAALGAMLSQECGKLVPTGMLVCPQFDRDAVIEIIQSLATGFEFEEKIFEDLANSFDQTRYSATPATRFTLAHVHAVCHILAGARRVSYDEYKEGFDQQNLDALHYAINVCEFMGFVEDIDWPNSAWLRNIIKVALKESKERIAEFIKAHYEDLVPKDAQQAGTAVPAAGPVS